MAHTQPTKLGRLALFVLALGVAACRGPGPKDAVAVAPDPHPAPAVTAAATPTGSPTALANPSDATCSYAPSTGTLPTWARAGFSPPFNGSKFVISTSGHIVAVLFGDPLHAGTPGPTQRQNKILWVPDDPSAGALTVDGHLVGTNENVDIGDISFGPSYVNVPVAGCWRFTLHWMGGTDTVDIVYGNG
jgi:hypothetical protein